MLNVQCVANYKPDILTHCYCVLVDTHPFSWMSLFLPQLYSYMRLKVPIYYYYTTVIPSFSAEHTIITVIHKSFFANLSCTNNI